MNRALRLLTLSLMVCCTACTSLSTFAQRKQHAAVLAARKQWQESRLSPGALPLVAYLPRAPAPTVRLTIYIEGDGLAWITGDQVSRDPTPADPVALRLALAQPDGAAAYLGRPCQYVDAQASHCASRFWTEARFSAEVVVATDLAIDSIKNRFGARQLTLVGYSGGAAVAALVAAQRRDVDRLVSVSGNLNPAAWTAWHHLAPLVGSQNPADHVRELQGIAQWHLVGERDMNVTPALVRAFVAAFPQDERPPVMVVPGFDHHCCWTDRWPELWRDLDARMK
jgi:dienelactone hydrolase